MSWEEDFRKRYSCPCGKGEYEVISYSDDWGSSKTGYAMLCPECKKKYVYDHEIDDIMVARERAPEIQKYVIKDWRASSGKDVQPQVSLLMTGENVQEDYVVGRGNGPVDAMIHAISNATGIHKDLVDFKVHSTAVGSDAPGKVTVYIKDNNGKEIEHMGVAIDHDIVLASAKAYVNALNRMRMYHTLQDQKQKPSG